MAIYSLSHRPIGKTTQKQPFTAAAHVGYITRSKALSHLDGARVPVGRKQAISWFRQAETTDRKNARVADKVMLALPRELTSAQRVALVRDFAETLTQGRAGWLAAFHERGKDAKNPHCHLIIRDRDTKTGKRVIGMSEAGSTEKLREMWEIHANRALEAAGRAERVDRRTLAAQGIKRSPTIHEGVRAQQMHRRGARPQSRSRIFRNWRGARQRTRNVDYSRLDRGISRPAYNEALRAQKGGAERSYWLDFDRDRQRRELGDLERIHRPDRYPDAEKDGQRPVHEFWMTWANKDDPDLEL